MEKTGGLCMRTHSNKCVIGKLKIIFSNYQNTVKTRIIDTIVLLKLNVSRQTDRI